MTDADILRADARHHRNVALGAVPFDAEHHHYRANLLDRAADAMEFLALGEGADSLSTWYDDRHAGLLVVSGGERAIEWSLVGRHAARADAVRALAGRLIATARALVKP